MSNRREFLGTLGAIALPASYLSWAAREATASAIVPLPTRDTLDILTELADTPGTPDEIARDESFWAQCQSAFTVDRSLVNFNNGGVSPTPRIVQEAMKRHYDFANSHPTAMALFSILEPGPRNAVRERLAHHWGADAEEIAITRNSSESLHICQLGLDLSPGDEMLAMTCDYPRMLNAFRLRERRQGCKLVLVKLPIPAEDDDEILRRYREAITPRTRVILMSHIVNITGQILPVRKVVGMARGINGGIPVIVDGAHALAHFAFKLPDLGCDYYGVSLHKWLFAPHGTGLLYVKRDRIKSLWPMFGTAPEQDDNIRKFEEVGTHPAGNFLAIGEALTFHQTIGDARKEARLRYLRDTWAKRLLATGKCRLHTSLKPQYSCGIGTIQVEGVDSAKIGSYLWDTHRIAVTPIKHDEFEGLRVTPSVYSTMEEVDRFCSAVEYVIKHGLPTTP
ncbi:MAG: aminotransferase class V-fold PLP-dependent enzyme [Phycisphaerales bacterium]